MTSADKAADCTVLPTMQAPYLGTRTQGADGQPGPYEWITYAQAIFLLWRMRRDKEKQVDT